MFEVHVYQRADDWHACLNGDTRRWGCGPTVEAAVVECLRSHAREGIRADAPIPVKLMLPLALVARRS